MPHIFSGILQYTLAPLGAVPLCAAARPELGLVALILLGGLAGKPWPRLGRCRFFNAFRLSCGLGPQNRLKALKNPSSCCWRGLPAEREGFEPPDLLQSTVFKTAAIDRSAISPGAKVRKTQIL